MEQLTINQQIGEGFYLSKKILTSINNFWDILKEANESEPLVK